MHKLFLYILVLCLSSTAIAQNTHNQQVAVYFGKDQAELSIEAQNKLTETLQSILNLESYSVKIEAHTDSDGSLTYNQLLSEKRANSVYEFLLLQGMSTQDLQIVAQGETDPAFSNQTETGQQKNRRVDVFFMSKSSQKHITQTEPKIKSFDALKRLSTTNTEQRFAVTTAKEQEVRGRKGTKLTIPPNAFVLEDGTELPKGAKVDIEMQEAISLEDMLLNNLSTMSGNRRLETGGMVNITASYKGKNLRLRNNTNIAVQVPKGAIPQSRQNDMELFYGVTQADGTMDWEPTRQKVDASKPHPKIEIDIRELENLNLPKLTTPVMGDLAKIPNKLYRLYAPVKPTAPSQKRGFLKRYRSKKAEKRNKQKMEKEQLEYEERLAKYEEDLERFNKWKVSFHERLEARKCSLEYNLEVIDTFRVAINQYNKYLRSWVGVKHLKRYIEHKGLTSKKPQSIFKYFFRTRETPLEVDSNFIAEKLGFDMDKTIKHWVDFHQRKYGGKTVEEVMPEVIGIYSVEKAQGVLDTLDKRYINKKKEMGIYTDSEYFGFFTTSISRLGWINIDRWIKEQEIHPILVVEDEDKRSEKFVMDSETRFYTFSHTFNSCVTLRQGQGANKDKITIHVPVGEKFTLIGMKLEDGEMHLATKSFEGSKNILKLPIAFEKSTLANLKRQLRDLEMGRSI